MLAQFIFSFGRLCLKIARRRSREQLFVYCLASQVFVTEKNRKNGYTFAENCRCRGKIFAIWTGTNYLID